MSPPAPPAMVADLDALGEDARAELIDGVIYERPVTTFDHARIAFPDRDAVAPAYEDGIGGPGGWWIAPEAEFAAEVFRPDVAGWHKERIPEPSRDHRVAVVPDWACEVSSKSNADHDDVMKRAAYARIGVRWWWLVDPRARTLVAHVLDGGEWRVVAAHAGSESVRVAPFELVELSKAEWWR